MSKVQFPFFLAYALGRGIHGLTKRCKDRQQQDIHIGAMVLVASLMFSSCSAHRPKQSGYDVKSHLADSVRVVDSISVELPFRGSKREMRAKARAMLGEIAKERGANNVVVPDWRFRMAPDFETTGNVGIIGYILE